MKFIAFLSGCFIFLSILAAGPSNAQVTPKCYWTLDMDQAYCAPPFGDIIHDVNRGKFRCGLGQCVISPTGAIRCSSVPGGAAVIDSKNRAACVGGCQDGEESLCLIPRP